MDNTKQRTSIWPLAKLVLILTVIAVITAGVLALINELTYETIAVQEVQKTNEALGKVLPADTYEEVSLPVEEKTVLTAYVAKSGDAVIGHCIKVAPNGYGGAITMIVGVDLNGAVTKVAIVDMSETSGIGTKTKGANFLAQYSGHAAEITASTKTPIGENEIAAITGATISSKAVTAGVNAALKTAALLQAEGGSGNV